MAESRNRREGGGKGGRSGDRRGGGKSFGRGPKGGGKGYGRGPKGGGRQGKAKPHAAEYRSQDPDEPLIPAGIIADDLDKAALRALSTLSGANQEIVARHLVAAGQLIDIDPELAYRHAQAAVRRAGRVDVVREAAALTAYASGRYEEALREVRAVRRMRGDESLRAIEADSERGMGHPEKAVAILEEVDTSTLPLSEQVELVLVAAGARSDLKQLEFALVIVEQAQAKLPADADPTLVRRLGLMQADLLEQLGNTAQAEEVLQSLPEEEEPMEIVDLDALMDSDATKTRTDLRGSDEPLSKVFDGAMIDLDGVCYHGDKVYGPGPQALATASDNGMILGFVTNNASRSAQEVADKMDALGYDIDSAQVTTSAMDLITDLKSALEPESKILVVGAEPLRRLAEEAGFVVVDRAEEGVVAVVQGLATDIGWEQLSEAAYALNAGAQYYATNSDASLPTERGEALGNGALVAAVSRATGKRATFAGKPGGAIFSRTAERLGISRGLIVGDRISTDIVGAIAARTACMHVLTGVSTARDVVLAERGARPSFLALGVEGINEIHPRAINHRDGTWTCGVSQAVKIDRRGTIFVNEIPLVSKGPAVTLNLDTYRALAAAAWDFDNERQRVSCPELVIVPNEDTSGIVLESNAPQENEQ